jgi:hypothetical protein
MIVYKSAAAESDPIWDKLPVRPVICKKSGTKKDRESKEKIYTTKTQRAQRFLNPILPANRHESTRIKILKK